MKEIITKLEDGKLLLEISKELYEKEAVFTSAVKRQLFLKSGDN